MSGGPEHGGEAQESEWKAWYATLSATDLTYVTTNDGVRVLVQDISRRAYAAGAATVSELSAKEPHLLTAEELEATTRDGHPTHATVLRLLAYLALVQETLDTLRGEIEQLRAVHGRTVASGLAQARLIVQYEEALEPGKASAIVMGLFELAERLGHSPASSTHALTFFEEEIERLRAVDAQHAADHERYLRTVRTNIELDQELRAVEAREGGGHDG